MLVHLCHAFPVCSESPYGNLVAVNSQCIDLCNESRLSNGDRRNYPVFGVSFGGKCVSGDSTKKSACNDRCGILKCTKHVRRQCVEITRGDREWATHSATIGPSAIFLERLISSRRPPHFLVFFTDTPLSPPIPIHKQPSAVPAAIAPVDETERQSTKGGDSDTPDDCDEEAWERCDSANPATYKEPPTELSSRKYRAVPEMKME